MTKSKSGGLLSIPKEQKCSFLIGPVSSWFMPNTIDLWTQPLPQPATTNSLVANDQDTSIGCDRSSTNYISYLAYGSIGCFCLGEIHHHKCGNGNNAKSMPKVGAIINRLADVKNDNSRVACVRFQRSLPYPIVVVLTESGSLLIYDCLLRENLVLFKKAEVLRKFVGLNDDDHQTTGEHRGAKRTKFNVTQQLNSCTWPNPENIFVGVSLLNEKTCLLVRLKLSNILEYRDKIQYDQNHIVKDDIVIKHQRIDLNLKDFTSPICLIESVMLDDNICMIATATDDGLITVISINLEEDRVLRTIKLARHTNQICSLSIHVGDKKKFPMGLLASVSRDGLVLIWDIENEFYFADYLAIQVADRSSSAKINWFALRFITMGQAKPIYLAVSNVDSGLSLLKLPENGRSKIRLKEIGQGNRDLKGKPRQPDNQTTLKHNALIFNIEYDPITQLMISSSLDGNQILWSIGQSKQLSNPPQGPPSEEIKQQFLIPALLDNARTHMLRHNPINENLLCLALGKAGVRFYSIAENLLNSRYDMSSSCSLIARKMAKASVSPTSIAWHPQHEYRLAIGTLEGKIYRVDITPRKAALVETEQPKPLSNSIKSNNKFNGLSLDDVLGVEYQPVKRDSSENDMQQDSNANANNTLRPKTDGVYSLCWGPNPACPEDMSRYAIYAIGSVSHRLFIYCSVKENGDKLTNYLDDFQDTSLPEAQGRASEVAWKSNMDMMALGTSDGRIIIVTYLDESHQERSNHKLFKHLLTVQGPFGSSYIQCLAWHPSADKEDPSYYKIVASSYESPAYVFNLKETVLVADVRARLRLEQTAGCSGGGGGGGRGDDVSSVSQTINLLASYTNKLSAHEKAITDIAWNPHEPGQLATCSFDRTCYVWSIDGGLMDARVTAKFLARDRLFTLDWSLVDEDLIFTSGHDSVIWAWRPTENRHHIVSV